MSNAVDLAAALENTGQSVLSVAELRFLSDAAEALRALQAFKDYVHKRLDDAAIPKAPNGPHSAEGCRVGDRLDIALGQHEGMRDFARLGCYLVDHWVEGGDLDGGGITEWLTDAGVIEDVPGGFDSEQHEAGNHDVNDGDPWFNLTKSARIAKQWVERTDHNERLAAQQADLQKERGT